MKLPTVQRQLQQSMNQIITFCGKRRISISEEKSFELVFRKRSHISQAEKTLTPITLHTTPIQIKTTARFLGVHFDNKLTFREHITKIKNRAQHRILRLHTIQNQQYGPSNKTMVRLFKMYVRPLFEYGNIALFTAQPNHIKPWEILQTKYIRTILNKTYLNNNNTRKFAYLPTIAYRLTELAHKYYNKNHIHNSPINKFITNTIKQNSQKKTPYSIINNKYKR